MVKKGAALFGGGLVVGCLIGLFLARDEVLKTLADEMVTCVKEPGDVWAVYGKSTDAAGRPVLFGVGCDRMALRNGVSNTPGLSARGPGQGAFTRRTASNGITATNRVPLLSYDLEIAVLDGKLQSVRRVPLGSITAGEE